MVKCKIPIGYYLFIITSVILFFTVYPSAISAALSDFNIEVDGKFIVLTSIIGALFIILAAIINYHILAFISFKIMTMKVEEASYDDFKHVFSFSFIPVAAEKLICAVINILSEDMAVSISISQIYTINNVYVDFIIKLLNPFSVLFLLVIIEGARSVYKVNYKRIIPRSLLIFAAYILFKGEWLLPFQK